MNKKSYKNKHNDLFQDVSKIEETKSFLTKENQDFNGNKNKKVSFIQLFRFATKFDVFLILIGTIGSIGNAASQPIMLIIFMNIFDAFNDSTKKCASTTLNITNANTTENHRNDLLTKMGSQAIYLVYLGLATHFLSYLQVTFWLISSQRQTTLIRKKLFQSILKQDIGWFDIYKTGELNNRLAEEVNKIKDGIGDKCGSFINFVFTFIMCIITSVCIGWKLSLIVLSLSPCLFFSNLLFTKAAANLTNKELKSYAKAGSIAHEVLTAIRTVFAFNACKKEHARYVKNLDEAELNGIKKGFLNGLLLGFVWLSLLGVYAIGFWFGWYLSMPNPITGISEYSIGKILFVFFSIINGVSRLGDGAPFIETLTSARIVAYEIFNIIDRKPIIDSSSNDGIKIDKIIGHVSFENVQFNYPSRAEIQILKNLNFTINSGLTCALVGSSGCGKSTCVQLLQRFYDPTQGSIKIDGVDVKELNINWLRSNIGVVNQEPILFDTTISENIRFGKKDCTQNEIIQAAKDANAHDFIMNLPDKYETLCGSQGSQLSGGQKQRIAIARALIKNPKILLLDEATSALDYESESIVQSALDKARLGRTTIIVAHRLSTIRNADLIFTFQDGIIKESGSHDDLMKLEGIYYNLVLAQQTDLAKKSNNDEIELLEQDLEQEILDKEIQKEESIIRNNDKKNDKSPISKVILMNKPEWAYILIGFISSIIAGCIQPGFGIFISKAIGVGFLILILKSFSLYLFLNKIFSLCNIDEQKVKIQFNSVIIGLFAVTNFFAYIVQNGMFAIAGERLTKRIRSKAFESMLKQEIGWFDKNENHVGVLVTKLAVEAAAVQGATGIRIGFILMHLISLSTAIIISFIFGWPIALIIIGFIPLMILAGAFKAKMLAGYDGSDKKNLEEASKLTNDSINNIRTVVTLCKEIHFIEEYNKIIDQPHRKDIKAANINGIVLGFTVSIFSYSVAAAFSLGAYLISNNLFGMNLENIMLVLVSILYGAQSFGKTSILLPDYTKAQVAIKSLFNLFDRVPLIDNWDLNKNGIKLSDDNLNAEINFKQVEFTYPNRKEAQILNGLNLNIKNGQKIALVGSSGCGKSTITQLLERFYDADHGQVLLNNKDLKEFNLEWLRSKIGIVSQEPILFDISIRENIAYGDNSREVTMEEIILAAKKANIHDFISNLPMKYETNVGSKGTQLSGGQKQRIAIARAILRDPKVLILDEATSALDTESEKLVQDALNKAQEGRTCIIIAHRLSTIKNCDIIFVIKNGKVLESGTHDDLIKLNGFYKILHGQYNF